MQLRTPATLVLVSFLVVTSALVGAPQDALAAEAADQTAATRLVRAFELEEVGLTNPAGIGFSAAGNAFHVLESISPAVPGTADVVKVTPYEEKAGSARISAQIDEPINVTFDDVHNRLLAYVSPANHLIDVRQDTDGNLDPSTLVRHDVRSFGVDDPRGMTVDPVNGDLLILDAATPRIVRIVPAADGSFDDAAISDIDLQGTGVLQPTGLAVDPATGSLHVLSPTEQKLYEVSTAGDVIATHDVSELELADPQGMTFAPSGDLTDDAAQTSLYITDSGSEATESPAKTDSLTEATTSTTSTTSVATASSGQLLEVSFIEAPAVESALQFTSSLVQTIEAFNWNPPSPDSSGIVYLPASDRLMVSDGEVNEMPIYANANVFESTLTGSLVDTFTTLDFGNNEPTGITVDPGNGHLYISQDTPPKAVYELDPGKDGAYGTGDDIVTSFVTADFGATDPEGVSYAADLDRLFIADGLNNEIYQLAPGPNGVFDGVAPSGDDQVVDSFDTFVNGMEDPEGIVYNPGTGTLYIGGKTRNIGNRNFDTLLEVTTDGTLVQTIDVSAANPGTQNPRQKLSGLTVGPSSIDPTATVVYIADRGEDNNNDPNENDGRIYEMTLPASPTSPPVAVDDVAVTSQDTLVVIDVAANDSDPNGNLDATTTNTTCPTCSTPLNGSLVNNVNGTFDYTPNALYTGPDSFVYEICDTDALCDTATVNITVTAPNDPPVANNDAPITDEDVAVLIDVAGNDTDPDGNLDATTANTDCATCSLPANGSLVNNADGTFEYTPAPDFDGPDSFVYEICDTLGLCDTASVSVTVTAVADAPVANDDAASTNQDTAVIVDVAANDTDVDGDLDPASANSECVNGCDGAGNGTLADNGDGTITYTPDAGYTGADSFVYEICDDTSPTPLCDTATVNITISSGQLIYVASTSGGSVGGVSFKDEDILSFEQATGTWSMYFDGSDVGLGAGGQEVDAFYVDSDGSVLLSLGSDATLPVVGAVDDHDIVRFVPTSTGDATAGTYESYLNGEDFGLAAAAEDIDAMGFTPDGDLVVSTRGNYSAGGISGPDEDLIVLDETTGLWQLYFDGSAVGLTSSSEDTSAAAIGSSGDVYLGTRGSFDVPGLTGDGADIFVCAPLATDPITDCTFTMFWDGSTNGFGSEVLNGLHISGINGGAGQPPVAVDDVAVTSQDSAVLIDVAANDSDPNGNLDPATTNTACVGCADPGNGTLTNHGNGTFTFIPNSGYTGPDLFVYEICDTDALCDTATVTITVTVPNDPPVANDDAPITDEDVAVLIDVAGNDTDPDGNLDATTANTDCATCSLPANGSLVNNADGTFDYSPASDFNGLDSFVYEICDTLGLCDTASVSVTVNAVADAPVANDDAASTNQDTAVIVDVAANDTDVDGDLDDASANSECVNGCDGAGNGTLADNGDGTITYTPDAGYTGADSFVYEICDDTSPTPLCATATVNITISGGQLYYTSFDINTTVPGIGFEVRDEDIVAFDPATGQWTMYFDASDVGITSSDLIAAHVRADGSILMSFASTITVPGLSGGPSGGSVEDKDLILFTPASTGENTSGSFSFYFDGSDVGLDANSEDIVGVYEFAEGGPLAITTRGNMDAPGIVTGRDEDVHRFLPATLGAATDGTWDVYFDGSDVGLTASGDDLNGISFDSSGDMLFSTLGSYNAAGGAGDDEDVSRFMATSYGATTAGTAALELDLSGLGIDPAVDLDGLHISG